MSHPRARNSLSLEHAHEHVRIGMGNIAKRIPADPRVNVGGHEAFTAAPRGGDSALASAGKLVSRKMRAALRHRISWRS